jgi:hypothetical protein
MSLDNDLILAQQLEELQGALKRAQSAHAKEKLKTDQIVAAVYQAAKDAAVAIKPPKVTKPKKDTRKNKAEVALIHATDWQLGKKTASYGVDTCGARMEKFVEKVTHITDIQRKHHPVREAVLMLGGDMVEGLDIFPGQAWEIEAHLFEQLFEAARIIEHMVRHLDAHFERVRVICEFGNHGRIGRYGVNPRGDNIDRMAYKIAEDRTKDLKAVSWQSSDDWYQHFTIGNYRVLLVHGDEIRTYSGTPLFGIIKRVTSWAALTIAKGSVPPFDDCYMGHWHNPASITIGNGNRVFITGSPESGNVYAQEHLAAQARPSQRLHFIDPEEGRVASEYVIWLD